MQVIVSGQITVVDPSDELKAWCKKNLVLQNPEYTRKMRMHLWTGSTPATISLFQRDGNALILPYGCLRTVLDFVGKKDSVKVEFDRPKMVWYGCDIPLYDYQTKAVEAMLQAQYGILQAPAGSGKTQMGLELAVVLGRKTLWLTHTKDLLLQSKERAERYMSADLTGTITEGEVHIGKGITFATVQTMSALDLTQYRDTWDTVIVDECHRVCGSPTAVTQFSKVLNALAARHKYGLSATVHRADGMIAATYALLGEIMYQVSEEDVADKIMPVQIAPVMLDTGISTRFLSPDGTLNYAKLIDYLTKDEERNAAIREKLAENAGHYNLILSARVEHLQALMDGLPETLRSEAALIHGKTKKALREGAINDLREGRKRYLFATYALAKEGLDIPRLDRLYLTTPQKDYAIVTQSIGRIARTFPGKETPTAYDFIDSKIPYLEFCWKKRCTTYRKLKSTILERT